MPLGACGREQQVLVVFARLQFGFQPIGAVTEQRAAPEHVAQQMGVEDQQMRCGGPCSVFPGQLAAGNVRMSASVVSRCVRSM